LNHDPQRSRVRAVFLSDVHLGFRSCNAVAVLEFLRSIECEQLYLVGDIIDMESLRRSVFWPPAHQSVLDRLFEMARAGTRVVYVPGNHDADLRVLCNSRLGNIEIVRNCVHVTADGRRLWVTHGDEFDSKVDCPAWLTGLGNVLYDFILMLNRHCNAWRRARGLPYFALASRLKGFFSTANRYIADYESAVAQRAHDLNLDGVVCGHIHRPRIATVNGVLYCNDGDWVESCSALIETADGRLSLLAAEQGRAPNKLTRPLPDRLPTN
jgi:UDP-2,3-diacylglucosamine pyrophosphatase LpxH